MIIAIDGPTASGKSTIAELFAKRNNFKYINSGLMYRAFTYYCLNNNIVSKSDVLKLLDEIDINIINNIIKSKNIRTNKIDENVSYYSMFTEVREWLVKEQRKLGENSDIIMDGRDITTVVFKNADFKFYISADPKIRAKRRAIELNEDYDIVYKMLMKRDELDKTRKDSPLKIAKDAIIIDTTDMTIDEAVEFIEKRVNV